MKRIMIVENKNAKIEIKMESTTLRQVDGMYKQLCKSGLGWETKEFKTIYDKEETE